MTLLWAWNRKRRLSISQKTKAGNCSLWLGEKRPDETNDEILQKGIMNIYSCCVTSMIIPLFAFSLGIYHISAWTYCLNIE